MANPNFPNKQGRYSIKPVTIETVDQAVFDYFDKKLNIHVDSAHGRKKVPIMFASGERWKLIREQKGIRDENKTLILPLITVQRMDIDRTPGFGGMAQETAQIVVSSITSKKTHNLKNMIRERKLNLFPDVQKEKIVKEFLTIPFPDFATVYYQVLIWAQYTEQMNEMLEKLFYSFEFSDSFVMPVDYDGFAPKGNSYYFVGFRDGNIAAQNNFEEFTDQERIIRHIYNFKTPVYFIMSPKDKVLSYGTQKSTSKTDTGLAVVYKRENATEMKMQESVLSAQEIKVLLG